MRHTYDKDVIHDLNQYEARSLCELDFEYH